MHHNSGILENEDLRWQRNESVERRMGLDTNTVSPTSARTQTSSCNNEYQWLDATSTNIINLNAHRASSEYVVSRILARSGSPFRSTYENRFNVMTMD